MCRKIRETLEDFNGYVRLENMQNILRRAQLPTNPETIHDSRYNKYTWEQFLNEFLSEFVLRENENGVKHIQYFC